MKIRNGFVSNSSSSSFIIIGVKRSGDYDEIMENEDLGEGISSLYVEEKGYDYITGYVLADFSDDGDYLENTTVSLAEFNEKAQKVAEALNVDVSQVELVMGTRPS